MSEVMNPCPKCGSEIEMGYGLAGGGIGAYEYCTNDECDHFDKWPDPELSTPEEMEADKQRRAAKATGGAGHD